MSAPKFLFENVLTDLNVTASSHYQDHTIQGAVNTLTYEYWAFNTDTATVDIEYTGTINSLGVVLDGALFSLLTLYVSQNGVDYTQVVSRPYIRNGCNFITFANTSGNYFRVEFEKALTGVSFVRNLMLGSYLEFERCLMKSHSPAPFNRSTQFVSNQSGTGEFLGRSAKPLGFKTGYQFNMITATWGRNQFQQFVESAQRAAYYVLWNDELYPNESFFGWTDDDIGISYTGDAALMSASWDAQGVATIMENALQENLRLLENGEIRITEDNQFRVLE